MVDTKKIILASLIVVLVVAIPSDPVSRHRTRKYIVTSMGLIAYTIGMCESGMLFSKDHVNFYDDNLQPITCSGYVELTDAEFKDYR